MVRAEIECSVLPSFGNDLPLALPKVWDVAAEGNGGRVPLYCTNSVW